MSNHNYQPLNLHIVLESFDFPETLLGAVKYGKGHINDTYCVVCQPQEGDCIRFILQELSTVAFAHPEELMENMVGITSYLRKQIAKNGGDANRETLSLIPIPDIPARSPREIRWTGNSNRPYYSRWYAVHNPFWGNR